MAHTIRAVGAVLILAATGACGGGGDGSANDTTPTGPTQNGPVLSSRLAYSFKPGAIGFYYNPPTIVGNALYIGTSRGVEYSIGTTNTFYKFSLTLAEQWEYPLGSKEVRGAAALDAAGNIYFTVEEGRFRGTSNPSTLYLYSLDPSGQLRWTKEIRKTLPMYGMENVAVGADNTIYVGGNGFYAFDSNGNQKWVYSPLPPILIMNAPIIDPAGNIYFSSQNAIISLTSAGINRWSVTTTGEPYSSPAFSRDYSKLFVAVENKVYCLQATSGTIVWQFTPPGMTGVFRATPAVDDNDNVYLGTKNDTSSVFYAIRSDGAALLWTNPIGADLYSSPAIGADRTLYVGSEGTGPRFSDGRLHALDLATGAVKWKSDLYGDVDWSSVAITDDGMLYIASMDFEGMGAGLYAFRTDAIGGLLRTAGSARFHGSNENNGRRS
jgi:outer membrane protein assembly factor BamB